MEFCIHLQLGGTCDRPMTLLTQMPTSVGLKIVCYVGLLFYCFLAFLTPTPLVKDGPFFVSEIGKGVFFFIRPN